MLPAANPRRSSPHNSARQRSRAHRPSATRFVGGSHYLDKWWGRRRQLPLLPVDNPYVGFGLGQDQEEAAALADPAGPGRIRDRAPLQIADGYHRVCASYYIPVIRAPRS